VRVSGSKNGTITLGDIFNNGSVFAYNFEFGKYDRSNLYGWVEAKVVTLAQRYIEGTLPSGGSSQQTIPIQWKRPGDKKVLETSFSIAVHEN
jgi:hypothetical protein